MEIELNIIYGVHWSSIARNRKEWKNLGEQLKNNKEL
jgi:hypothetical protein